MAFVVSRKVGKAVVRNRLRRRLREGLRAMLAATPADAAGAGPEGRWPRSFDTLVVVRPTAAYHELTAGLRRALDQAAAAAAAAGPLPTANAREARA